MFRISPEETGISGNTILTPLTHRSLTIFTCEELSMFTRSKHFGMIPNEIVSRIAQKIRSTRLKKNLTIQELADRTRVSKGLLSKIENSRTLPSLPVFIQIVQSLDVSLKEFFEDMALMNGKDYILIRKDNTVPMEREGRIGFKYRFILSQSIATGTMEAVILTLEPGATGRPTITDGFEFKYIISGSCEYNINNEKVEMHEGDSIYFDASVPHLPSNNSNSNCVMLVIYFIIPR
jgi:transcriptional regulator with XRE-family HTH domain